MKGQLHAFRIHTRLLAAIGKWAYQHDDRPHISQVLFDGRHVIATDGHRMVVATCVTGLPPFTLQPRDTAVLAAAQREIHKRRSAELVFLTVSEGKAAIDLDEGRCTVIVKTGTAEKFPPWQELFKNLKAETPTPPAYAFNPQYLAAIDEVIQGVTGDGPRTVSVKAWTGWGPGEYIGPMLFECVAFEGDAGYEMQFLIMPKRS